METLGKRFENKHSASGGGLTKTTIFSKTQNVNVNLRTFLQPLSISILVATWYSEPLVSWMVAIHKVSCCTTCKYKVSQLQSGHTSICIESSFLIATIITKTPCCLIHLIKTDVENVSAWIHCYCMVSVTVIVGRLRWLSWPSSCPSQCWHHNSVSHLARALQLFCNTAYHNILVLVWNIERILFKIFCEWRSGILLIFRCEIWQYSASE